MSARKILRRSTPLLVFATLAAGCGGGSTKEPVPNVVGKQVRRAIAELRADRLRWSIARQEGGTPAHTYAPGTVIAQTPRHGDLDSGSTVRLVVDA